MAKRTNNPACRKKKSPSGLDPALQRRVVIEHVRPQVDCGRFPIKRVVGERVVVRADVFADGGRRAEPPVDVKTLHAKIGQLALENDFLEHALGKAGLLSAKR